MKAVFLRDEGMFENAEKIYLFPCAWGGSAPMVAWNFRLAAFAANAGCGGQPGSNRYRARSRRRKLGETEAERQGERLKWRYCRSVAHDFRTPLASIKAATRIMATENSDPSQRRELTIIDEECDRLNRLVEEAAEMSRLEAGEFELELCRAHADR